MLADRRSILPAFTLFAHFIPAARAAVTLHYFAHTSCNAGTALSEYTSRAPVSPDGSCHYAPDNTVAIYVDGIDPGCTGTIGNSLDLPPLHDIVRTYGDATCTSVMGLSITVGTCYYSSDSHAIGSYKFVCGSGLGAAPASPDSASTTMSITSTSSSDTGSASTAYTGPPSTTTLLVAESTIPSTTSMIGDHPATTGKTSAPATTYTCSGNCTWTTQTGPTSNQPGFQTGGLNGANGAEGKELGGWRKHALKGLMAMGAAEALWGFI